VGKVTFVLEQSLRQNLKILTPPFTQGRQGLYRCRQRRAGLAPAGLREESNFAFEIIPPVLGLGTSVWFERHLNSAPNACIRGTCAFILEQSASEVKDLARRTNS